MADFIARIAGYGTRAKMAIGVCCGLLAGLGQAPWGLWWLTLVMLAAIAMLLDSTRDGRQGAWLGWAFGVGYFALVLNWLVEPFLVDIARHGWMAPFALFGLAAGLSLFWALAFGVARWLGPGRHAPLVLVVTLTGVELLRAYVFTGFPWGMLSYIWLDTAPMQLVAWIGPHGLTLLTLLLTAGTYWLAGLPRGRVVAGGALLWGGVIGASVVLSPPPMDPAGGRPVVRLIQPNAAQHLKWDEDMIPVFFQRQIEFTGAEAGEAGAPDLIVWPETAVPTLLDYADSAFGVMSRAAGEVPVAMGIQRQSGGVYHNSLAVIDADATVTHIYDKSHLVPFGEYVPGGAFASALGLQGFAAREGFGYAPGAGPDVLDLGARLGKAMPLICYEAVFPQDVNAAPERADWLLQITNDAWFGENSGPYQHLAQARFRAVEQGLPMARVANTGVSAMIDAYGRVVAQLPLGQAGYLDVALPQPLGRTPYGRSGDMPVFLLLAGLFAGFLMSARRYSN